VASSLSMTGMLSQRHGVDAQWCLVELRRGRSSRRMTARGGAPHSGGYRGGLTASSAGWRGAEQCEGVEDGDGDAWKNIFAWRWTAAREMAERKRHMWA
jgi:hypothetical protein